MTVSETSVPSSVSETCEETVNVTTMTKPLTTAAGDRAIATVKPSMAKVIENRLSRLHTSTATFNVDSDGCYTVNDLLAFEPPQSAPTMFRLLIWEVYQRYFSMRPMVEMQIFLFARLYRLLVHEISADATFTCGMKCSMSKSKMSFKEYLSHVETLEHVENTVRFINRKQPFGWKALRNTLGRRSWFCEICTDFETTKAYRSRDIKRHLHTSQEHKRRHALILEYLQDVKSEQHTQKTICPIPKRIQTIQSEFQRLTRHKVEFWMRSRNPKDKFKCTLQKCKDMTFNSIEEYLDHCQSYYHMLTMYSYFHSLGASNVFNEYIKLSRYSAMDKRYFCGICAWRRPSDNLEVDSLLSHTKSREHERNLELLTECFRRDEQRCIYRCADNCSIDHAPLLFTKRKTVEVPNLTKPSTSSTSNPRIQLTWKPATSVLPSPTADALKKFSASTDTAATISTSESNSSIDKLSEAFPARKWAKSTIAKKGTTLVASALAEAVARAKKRSEEILEDLAAHSSSRKTASGSNLSEIHSLDKHVIKSASNPLAAKVIPQMRVSSQPVIADSPSHSDKSAPATSTGNKPVFRLSSKTMQDILQEARAAENQEKKTFGASPTVTSKEYTNYLSNDLSGLKTQPVQKPHIYDSDDSSKPVSLMCKIPLSAVPVTDHLKKESKHQKKKHKKAKKAKKQTKTKLPMAYSDPNVSRSPDSHRSRRKTPVSDLSDDDQYSKSSEYTTGSKRSHRRSQSPDQNRKRPRNLYSSSSDKTYGSSRSRSNETHQRRRRRSRSYGSSDDSEGKKSKFKTKKGESYSVSKHRQHQSSSRSPRSSYRKSYSYERNKEHLRRKPRRNTSSSSLDSTKQSAASKYTKTRRRKRSRSSSFSNSSYNHTPSPHRRNFSSSRSRSHSPRSRRYSRWSRSRSKSDSPDFKGNRLSRHLSPPPFPQHNFSIYCIGDGGDHPRLTMRSLSPMSEDTVSKTVENAWNVYYNRYYSKKSYSLDDVLNSQYVFLKSYSGFFTTPSNFENCYDTSLKPEDLKSALRLRLSRLSPGPTRKSSELHLKQPKKKLPSSTHVNLPTAVKTKDTALSMESLIRTGAVPGLAMLNDNSSPTAVTNTHDIQSAIQSLRQSFSQANLKKENPEQSTCQSGSTLKTATADSKYSFLPLHSSNSEDKSAIPFLNDGTLAQRKSSPRRDSPAQSVKQPQDTETPWHYSERWSPTDQYKDQAKDKAIAKRKTSGRTRPSRFSDPIPTTTVETPLSASSSFEQPSSVKPLVSYYEDDSSDMVEGNDAEENEAVKSPENPVKPSDQVHAVGGVVMSAFIGEVVRGIIRLSTLPGDNDLSPEQRDAETELERSRMHSRMTSAAGHYMIHMARCRLSQPERLTKDFTEADAEAVDLIQSMDDRVVELIASTPFLDD